MHAGRALADQPGTALDARGGIAGPVRSAADRRALSGVALQPRAALLLRLAGRPCRATPRRALVRGTRVRTEEAGAAVVRAATLLAHLVAARRDALAADAVLRAAVEVFRAIGAHRPAHVQALPELARQAVAALRVARARVADRLALARAHAQARAALRTCTARLVQRKACAAAGRARSYRHWRSRRPRAAARRAQEQRRHEQRGQTAAPPGNPAPTRTIRAPTKPHRNRLQAAPGHVYRREIRTGAGAPAKWLEFANRLVGASAGVTRSTGHGKCNANAREGVPWSSSKRSL